MNRIYAESKNKPAFDWNEFLARSSWSNEDLLIATDLAANWVTCACGNQCEIIPRRTHGCPVDFELKDLGLKFSEAIGFMRWARDPSFSAAGAREILAAIEKRSAHLMSRMT